MSPSVARADFPVNAADDPLLAPPALRGLAPWQVEHARRLASPPASGQALPADLLETKIDDQGKSPQAILESDQFS